MDYSKISPWNVGDYPVKVNNIRFNQNNTLFTLATSRGYKIFSAKTLKKVQEETELVRELGDLSIVMTYYESNIVFFTGKKNNENITSKELIIFDDFSQKKIGEFKSKGENIINFYVSKNALFVALENNLVILELISMKIINIVENVEINNKLVTFNINDTISFLLQNNKKNIYIQKYIFKNNILSGIIKKDFMCSFDWVQYIKLSQSGKYIAMISLFGNKIHIYKTDDCSLLKCILIGIKIYNIENISFIYNKAKENYLLLNINNNTINIYKINSNEKCLCVCENYLDDDILTGKIKNNTNNNLLDYLMPKRNNGDITEYHINIITNNNIIFSEFFLHFFHKSFVIIDSKGYYYIYFFNKEKPISYAECKWI